MAAHPTKPSQGVVVTDIDTNFPETSFLEVSDVVERAVDASPRWRALDPSNRAEVLRAVADRLDLAGAELVPLAISESHLTETRLRGELFRTTFQLRFLAGVIDEGDYLQACIDTADESWPLGPRPDLRRLLRPLGPVAVFAASNFPFAFSVAGGDSASALAAGCPVVLKAHPGHRQLSARCGAIVCAALRDAGDRPKASGGDVEQHSAHLRRCRRRQGRPRACHPP
jgi:NADP-dependent aldehyde dehydrogenase